MHPSIALAIVPLVAGTPFNARNDDRGFGNVFCEVVDDIVTMAREQSSATAFCSSYLGLSPTESFLNV